MHALIPVAPTGRKRRLDMRHVLNAMLYIVGGGVQWRLLPNDYPNHNSVYYYFRKWHQDGTWKRIHHRLRKHVRRVAGRAAQPSAGSIDSQSINQGGDP